MMQDVIYDLNVSVDGFIAGSGGDISMFPSEGPWVDTYLVRLAEYRVAIMGRAICEFGYRFGLKPGANPYPHSSDPSGRMKTSVSEVILTTSFPDQALRTWRAETGAPS
jgi:hypothetical protein